MKFNSFVMRSTTSHVKAVIQWLLWTHSRSLLELKRKNNSTQLTQLGISNISNTLKVWGLKEVCVQKAWGVCLERHHQVAIWEMQDQLILELDPYQRSLSITPMTNHKLASGENNVYQMIFFIQTLFIHVRNMCIHQITNICNATLVTIQYGFSMHLKHSHLQSFRPSESGRATHL